MKVVIWGHKPFTHTHSHIHSSYYKSFKSLGYDVYWLDSSDNLDENFFDDSIIFSEGSGFDSVPVRKGNKYISHHNREFFEKNNIPEKDVVHLANYVEESEKFEKINDLSYFDRTTNTIYQAWATDLLPEEIDDNEVYTISKDRCNSINYVGSLYEESLIEANNLAEEIKRLSLYFVLHMKVSDERNKRLVRSSFVSLDIRAKHHKNVGYIPCRVFKNTSYGRITGTNSANVKRVLGDHVVYDENVITLFYRLMLEENIRSLSKRRDDVKFIKENHTFINRTKNILKLL